MDRDSMVGCLSCMDELGSQVKKLFFSFTLIHVFELKITMKKIKEEKDEGQLEFQ